MLSAREQTFHTQNHTQTPEVRCEIAWLVCAAENARDVLFEGFTRLRAVAFGRGFVPLCKAFFDHGIEQQILALKVPVNAAYGQA